MSATVVLQLVLHAVGAGLNETALFIAELLASSQADELSCYALALAHWRVGEPRAAIEILRQRIVVSSSEASQFNGGPLHRATLGRPANEASVRCAHIYASCCGELGRPREGEEVLAKAIRTFGPSAVADFSIPVRVSPSPASLYVQLGRLAVQAGQIDKAAAYFLDALREQFWCWEAYEALCSLGQAPDPESIFGGSGRSRGQFDGFSSTGSGIFTPMSSAVPLPGVASNGFGASLSFDDSSASLEPSFFGPTARRAPGVAAAGPSHSVFTPDGLMQRSQNGPTAPQKRARPDSIVDGILPGSADTERAPIGARTRSRAGPGKFRAPPAPPSLSGESTASAPSLRRSSRLSKENSRDTPIATNGNAGPLQPPALGGRIRTVSGNPRDRKRAKANSDDATTTTLSNPRSSSSPEPFSSLAGLSLHAGVQDELMAEDWLRDAMTRFGRATWALSRFECSVAIETIRSMPTEMRQSWRALLLLGRARFETLDYVDAEKAFRTARDQAPYLLRGSEYHSTLLWHLNRPTALAVLAQQLMQLAPASPQAWVATGNVFSQLEDHTSALKCFQRAAQADPTFAYAYTLAGHECVALEEWDRALNFFREAIGRERRQYNAWFGLGNVYLKTAKYRLAEYHFREAMAINPNNAMLICCVGTVLDKMNRPAEALAMYEQACAAAPHSAAVRFKRVRALVVTKQYKLARDELEELKSSAQTEFNVHFLLGRLHGLLGDRSAMIRHLTYAQELDPRSAPRVREAIEAKPVS